MSVSMSQKKIIAVGVLVATSLVLGAESLVANHHAQKNLVPPMSQQELQAYNQAAAKRFMAEGVREKGISPKAVRYSSYRSPNVQPNPSYYYHNISRQRF